MWCQSLRASLARFTIGWAFNLFVTFFFVFCKKIVIKKQWIQNRQEEELILLFYLCLNPNPYVKVSDCMEGSVKIALSYQQNIQFIFPCYVFTKFEFVYRQISYDNGSQNLNVHVMECQNLKKMDTFGKSDPYVKVYLLPGSFDIMKTDVIKKNLNPYFNAMFRFNVITSEIVNTENFTFSI